MARLALTIHLLSPQRLVRVALVGLSVGFGVAYLFGPSEWIDRALSLHAILPFGIAKWVYGTVFITGAALMLVPRRDIRAAGYMLCAALFAFFALLFLLHLDQLQSPLPVLNYFGNAAFFAAGCYETLFNDRRRSS